MFRKSVLLGILTVIVATLAVGLPTRPALAVPMATINAFHATCTHFSVDVAVAGLTDDQAGFDRFRYLVTDGLGNTLYEENSARMVGASDRAVAVGLSYAAGAAPEADPVTFAVVDLDVLGRPVGVRQETVLNNVCAVERAAGTDETSSARAAGLAALLPTGVVGHLVEETTLYTDPDGDALAVTLERGRELTALFTSVDHRWIAVYVGGENLVWVMAPAIDVEPGLLDVQPQQIDRSQQVSGAVLPPGFPVATARTRYVLNFRTAPSTSALRLGRIPWRTEVPVYGRSADSQWLLVTYNGVSGWASARYVTLFGLTLSQLPVVG